MRLGVLDIGSNTGTCWWSTPTAAPRRCRPPPSRSRCGWPSTSTRTARSATPGVDALVEFVGHALEIAEDKGCEEIYSFATSAVRDADNADDVLRRVRKKTGVDIRVLPGEDEARLTFLAVRRWFGWSSGRLAVFDIGGGSLEIAGGDDESPDVAWSLPLGAGRLTREHFRDGRLDDDDAARAAQGRSARRSPTTPAPCCAAARPTTPSPRPRPSARWPGSAVRRPPARACSYAGSWPAATSRSWIPKLLEMDADEMAELPGVSRARAHQLVAGALVAAAVMDIFDLAELEICPWALREGVILDRLDQLSARRLRRRRWPPSSRSRRPRSIPRRPPTPSTTPTGSATTPSR